MVVNFVHICEHAFFSETKKLCVVEIFEEMTVTPLPGVIPKLTLVIGIQGRPIGKAKVVVKRPTGDDLFSVDFDESLYDEGKDLFNLVVNATTLAIIESGEHTIQVYDNCVDGVNGVLVSPERTYKFLVK